MSNRILHAIALTGLLLAAGSIGGCALISYPVAALRGPETEPAVYDLKKHLGGGKIVVWVRAIPEELEARDVAVRDLMGRQVSAKLKVDAKVPIVSYAEVERLFRAAPGVAMAAPQQIGQKVGAQKVLYIDVRQFAVRDTPHSSILRGRLHATVAVIDAKTGEQDWPTGGEGHSMNHEDETRETERKDQTAEVAEAVVATVADKIAKLFYDYTPPE
jgi:hypothetical protein